MDVTARAPRLPDAGETVRGTDVLYAPGGKGANQAIACARTHVPTALVACRGDDQAGTTLQDYLEHEDLDVTGLSVVPGSSGCGHVQCDEDGQNRIISVANANGLLTPDMVKEHSSIITSSKVVLTQLVIPFDAALAALLIARTNHVTTILNPSPATAIADVHLALVDILVPNEVEAAQLTGIDTSSEAGSLAAAWELSQRGPGIVILTRGAGGVVFVENSHAYALDTYPVLAIDATGAGDAFCGGLASALAREVPLQTALRLASAFGALATTKMGSYPAIASYDNARALIASHTLEFRQLPLPTSART